MGPLILSTAHPHQVVVWHVNMSGFLMFVCFFFTNETINSVYTETINSVIDSV